jgi:sulfur oxidation c-type cytochrome SoxX
VPDDQEQHYDINKLHFVFAIASIILLVTIGWMFAADYSREWRDYQKEFRKMEMVKTRVKHDAETIKLNASAEFTELEKNYQAEKTLYIKKCPDEKKTTREAAQLKAETDLINQNYQFTKAELDAAKYEYEKSGHDPKATKSKQQAATKRLHDLEKKVSDISLKLEESNQRLKVKNDLLAACHEQLKALEQQERTLTKQKSILERKLSKVDPASMSFTNQIADMVRDMPIIDFANPNYKVDQIVLKDITDDVVYMRVPKVDRCTTCHLGIANPEYKNAPQPFTAHPNLELYIGKNSPHPLEEFGCTSCHQGRGRGTDFVSAAHTPSSKEEEEEWKKKYHWHEYHHWETPMYPVQYTEAGCFKCHSTETTIKGAEKLNLGMNLIERAGCYACHVIDKYKDWPKPGPDLTHVGSKLSKEWTYRWIADPRAFRPDTWMPSYFGQSNNNDPESTARSAQEIHAMVTYLFSASSEFPVNPMPSWGDPKKGEEIVTAVGCLACHKTQPAKEGTPTTRQTLHDEHGPSLTGLANKTSKEWIYNWIKDPVRYHPETRMPNFRLSDQEAADVAAYLATGKNDPFETKVIPAVDEAVVNAITAGFLRKTSSVKQTQEQIAKMSLEEKLKFSGERLIGQYGCYSCHNIKGFENFKPIGTELNEEGSKTLHNLDFGFVHIEHSKEAWFRQKLKDPRIFDQGRARTPDEKLKMPNFYLKDEEIEAISTVLLGLVKDKPAPSMMKPRTPENLYIEEGQKLIRQFNCQACHVIEGEGGAIQPKVVDWLVKYDGRSQSEAQNLLSSFGPPNLLGEGKKVQSEWLFRFLHEPVVIRPWLKLRMPTYNFNVAHLNALVKYFNAHDKQPFPFTSLAEDIRTSPEEIEAGKKLFSNDYFGCAQCHVVGNKLPPGTPDSWAPDLSLAGTRLKPEWVVEWIKNPTALMPGTKMPTFYDPNSFDQAGPEDVLAGDEKRQIKALRDYLFSLKPGEQQAQAPTAVPPAKVIAPAQEETLQQEKGLSGGSATQEKQDAPATSPAPAPTEEEWEW